MQPSNRGALPARSPHHSVSGSFGVFAQFDLRTDREPDLFLMGEAKRMISQNSTRCEFCDVRRSGKNKSHLVPLRVAEWSLISAAPGRTRFQAVCVQRVGGSPRSQEVETKEAAFWVRREACRRRRGHIERDKTTALSSSPQREPDTHR